MDKMSGGPRRDWDFELVMANALVMFGSNGTNLEHPDTTRDQSLLQNLDIGCFKAPNETVTVGPLGERLIEGRGHHLYTASSTIHEPSHGQPVEFQPDHGGMNRESRASSVLLGTDDDSRPTVTDRIDELTSRIGYDDSRVTRPIDARKRNVQDSSFPSRVTKKQKVEPPLKVPPDNKPPTFPPTRPSEKFKPLRGGKNSKAKPLSTMCEEDYYYRRTTSLNDRTYFDNVIKNLRAAPYLQHPQTHEPTISSEAGVALVGEGRVKGPGCATGDESVYAILVDRPLSGPFLCWICGHLQTQRKGLRALGHVREHFEHGPWKCLQDHRALQNGSSKHRAIGPW